MIIEFKHALKRAMNAVDLGKLDQVKPISTVFGFDRGKPIDRYYIEKFLEANSKDIKGHVLEIGDNSYTMQYGATKVIKSDVLHATAGNPAATIVADITKADNIPSNSFDCIVLTQTLYLIYDIKAATKELYRILKPHGVMLITVPGISQISRYDMDNWGDYWRFTNLSAQKLFEEVFTPSNIEVKTYGNVLVATAGLYGLAVEDLTPDKFEYNDKDYQLIITARLVKDDQL